jgi:hypothetical protein
LVLCASCLSLCPLVRLSADPGEMSTKETLLPVANEAKTAISVELVMGN